MCVGGVGGGIHFNPVGGKAKEKKKARQWDIQSHGLRYSDSRQRLHEARIKRATAAVTSRACQPVTPTLIATTRFLACGSIGNSDGAGRGDSRVGGAGGGEKGEYGRTSVDLGQTGGALHCRVLLR